MNIDFSYIDLEIDLEKIYKANKDNWEHLYFDEDDLNEHFEDIVTTLDYLNDEVELHRIIFLKDISELNSAELGCHWVQDISVIQDESFQEYLQHQCNGETIEGTPFIISAKFKASEVQLEITINQFMLNPHEEEITLKYNSQPIGNIRVFDCSNNVDISNLFNIDKDKLKVEQQNKSKNKLTVK